MNPPPDLYFFYQAMQASGEMKELAISAITEEEKVMGWTEITMLQKKLVLSVIVSNDPGMKLGVAKHEQ